MNCVNLLRPWFANWNVLFVTGNNAPKIKETYYTSHHWNSGVYYVIERLILILFYTCK
jgi:hypothetical protein